MKEKSLIQKIREIDESIKNNSGKPNLIARLMLQRKILQEKLEKLQEL